MLCIFSLLLLIGCQDLQRDCYSYSLCVVFLLLFLFRGLFWPDPLERGRPSWQRLLRAKRTSPSSRSTAPSSWRCSWASVQRGCVYKTAFLFIFYFYIGSNIVMPFSSCLAVCLCLFSVCLSVCILVCEYISEYKPVYLSIHLFCLYI